MEVVEVKVVVLEGGGGAGCDSRPATGIAGAT